MTDSRLRGEWLGAVRFDDLSDSAWRVFTGALMWSNENGTDGHIPGRYLKFLHPDGEQPAAFAEIQQAGFWTQHEGGYQMVDWDGQLGQSTAEYVAVRKADAARRQRDYRKREQDKLAKKIGLEEEGVTRDMTRDMTRDVHAHVGEGKGEGQAKDYKPSPEPEYVNESTGEVIDSLPSGSPRFEEVREGNRVRLVEVPA